jgi:membrane protease YdiL (CAAX protease family)
MTTFLAYASRGRNAWWLYLLTGLGSLLLASVLGAVIIFGLLQAQVPASAITGGLEDPSHPVAFFTSAGVSFGVILAALLITVGLLQGKSLGDLVGAWSGRAFLSGAAIWAVLVVAGALIDYAIAPASFRFTASGATGVLALSALAALPIQTFAEEVVFRGWLTQGLLLATRRPWIASVIAGLLFGSVHIPNGAPQAVAAAVFGIAASRMAIRLGGLAFTFGLHLINNLFGAIVVVSSSDVFKGSAGIFTQGAPELAWFDVALETVLFLGLMALVLGPLGRRLGPPDGPTAA